MSSLALYQVKHFASLLLMIQQSLFPSTSSKIITFFMKNFCSINLLKFLDILRTLKCLIKTENICIECQNYNDTESLFELNDTV